MNTEQSVILLLKTGTTVVVGQTESGRVTCLQRLLLWIFNIKSSIQHSTYTKGEVFLLGRNCEINCVTFSVLYILYNVFKAYAPLCLAPLDYWEALRALFDNQFDFYREYYYRLLPHKKGNYTVIFVTLMTGYIGLMMLISSLKYLLKGKTPYFRCYTFI